jgi:O-methyltransferase
MAPRHGTSHENHLRPPTGAVIMSEADERLDPATGAKLFDEAIEMIKPCHSSMFWGDRMLTLDKSASFRDDPKFKIAMSTADSSTGQNQYASPDGITWRYNTLIWAARQAVLVDGDFVECGVYKGDMSWMVTEMVDLAGHQRELYLYDTFCGFSEKYSSTADFPERPEFFNVANSIYREDGLYEAVAARFSAKPYVRLIRGDVPDTLIETAPRRIAFLHLDLNSPRAERAALECLYDRISPGGVMVFDDYGWSLFHKQKQSADEFMLRHGHTILELPTGQGLAFKSC